MTEFCPSYYDIDAILAEEELVVVNNLLDFSHLAHLDPNYIHQKPTFIVSPSNFHSSQSSDDTIDQSSMTSSMRSKVRKRRKKEVHLPENTRFKMPLWSIKKWSELNFVRLSLPKHYSRKGRERLDADPVSVDLKRKSERFYMSGMALVDLIHACVKGYQQSNNTNNSSRRNNSARNNSQTNIINNLHNESLELKRTLLLTYTGARLRRTFDWTLSHIEDDVSLYTKNLTEMEQRLFRLGAAASHAFFIWKMHGSRRISISETALRANVICASNSHRDHNTLSATPGNTSKRSFSRIVSPNNNLGSSDRRLGNSGGNLNLSRKRMRSY